MLRRRFLQAGLAPAFSVSAGRVLTVRGPVRPDELGICLPHEHLFSNFGLDPADPPVYDEPRLLREVLRYVSSVRYLGAGAIADCTTQYFGRAPALLLRISEGARVHIITNSGYYGAAAGRYLPPHAHTESAGRIAARWTHEFYNGIADTRIRPGFLKLGIDPGPLKAIDEKLIRAAAITHRQTGLPIAVHTGDNPHAVRRQLAILAEENVSPAAWTWVHAHACPDHAALLDAARAGAFLSFDGIAPETVNHHLALVQLIKNDGRLPQVLLSHDGNSFRANGTRPLKPYTALFTHFLPALEKAGLSRRDLHRLTTENPARVFTIHPRLLRIA
jgi:predicted metal-dependent phosphotriesterase family hydrolase